MQGLVFDIQGSRPIRLINGGTTVDTHHVDRFPKVTAWKVRLTILKSDGTPAVRKFGLYLAR